MAASIAALKKQRARVQEMLTAGVLSDGTPMPSHRLFDLRLDIHSLDMAIGLAEDRKRDREKKANKT